ncbi:uncharacterized protein LOC115067964 [Nannospalax galili]|uniref:uncharacterized protein LOC115067964 n=1 Tax=Nannospalax galili TaxID=1026970 RepID=UPI00111C8935|nr:uncharacterized protein LOC115067964 [Nannospalax galili]
MDCNSEKIRLRHVMSVQEGIGTSPIQQNFKHSPSGKRGPIPTPAPQERLSLSPPVQGSLQTSKSTQGTDGHLLSAKSSLELSPTAQGGLESLATAKLTLGHSPSSRGAVRCSLSVKGTQGLSSFLQEPVGTLPSAKGAVENSHSTQGNLGLSLSVPHALGSSLPDHGPFEPVGQAKSSQASLEHSSSAKDALRISSTVHGSLGHFESSQETLRHSPSAPEVLGPSPSAPVTSCLLQSTHSDLGHSTTPQGTEGISILFQGPVVISTVASWCFIPFLSHEEGLSHYSSSHAGPMYSGSTKMRPTHDSSIKGSFETPQVIEEDSQSSPSGNKDPTPTDSPQGSPHLPKGW